MFLSGGCSAQLPDAEDEGPLSLGVDVAEDTAV